MTRLWDGVYPLKDVILQDLETGHCPRLLMEPQGTNDGDCDRQRVITGVYQYVLLSVLSSKERNDTNRTLECQLNEPDVRNGDIYGLSEEPPRSGWYVMITTQSSSATTRASS